MFTNYLKIAIRNLIKNKVFTFINIAGLATGMAVAMLIGLWVYDEVLFNSYHKNHKDIAQIVNISTDPSTGITESSQALQFPLGAEFKRLYGHLFKHVLMAFWVGDYTLSYGDAKMTKTGEFIEPAAPEMLSLKMLQGTYAALKDPNSIILSESTAKAIFGNENPLDKAIKIDNRINVIVRGVYEDFPKNTRFASVTFFSTWALWVSSNDWIKACENRWDNNSFNIYVQTKEGISMERANSEIKTYWAKNSPAEIKEIAMKYKAEHYLHSMDRWHLYSEFKNGSYSEGRITFVWLFGIIGAFVLLLACINFMNLSTARSEKRAKEVGIRKAIGSVKGQLVWQFMSESFMVVILAFTLSILLIFLSISWFNGLADKDLSLPLSNLFFWLISIAFITLTSFLAGMYPAFYLSSFEPVKVLKGTLRLGRFAAIPRKVLVVVQFTVSVVLIIGTIVVYKQIEYARNRPVGYDRDYLLSIPMSGNPDYKGKIQTLKNELFQTNTIEKIATSSGPMTEIWNNIGGYTWRGKAPERDYSFTVAEISHDFGKTVGWQFIKGRDFSTSFSTDSLGLVINETAAKAIGFKEPIGEFIKSEDGKTTWQIIGVIRDVVARSPFEPVEAAFYFLDADHRSASFVFTKIKPTESASQAVEKIQSVFKKIVPSAIFNAGFVDIEYETKFSQEQRIGKLATFFAILAIFISCLGLFGLASFVAEQRTKEIGVRKVLGATVTNLWALLSKDFVILVIISLLIASPIAYYFMNNWVQKYTYRTDISWWIFVAAGVGALLITLLTVSYQAIKAALMNPVKSLKTE